MFSPSEKTLVARALQQQPDACEALVLRYQRSAHAIAFSAGVSASALDDVVQQSFLLAFRKLPALRNPAAFGSWFASIVRNCARKHLRDRQLPSLGVDCPSPAATAEDDLDARELRDRVWLAQGVGASGRSPGSGLPLLP